jgi:hypothetical protein
MQVGTSFNPHSLRNSSICPSVSEPAGVSLLPLRTLLLLLATDLRDRNVSIATWRNRTVTTSSLNDVHIFSAKALLGKSRDTPVKSIRDEGSPNAAISVKSSSFVIFLVVIFISSSASSAALSSTFESITIDSSLPWKLWLHTFLFRCGFKIKKQSDHECKDASN